MNVPTYILGPNQNECAKYYDGLSSGDICPNVTYFGRRGLYTTVSGLKIAYISGFESCDLDGNSLVNFKLDDVKEVASACLHIEALTY